MVRCNLGFLRIIYDLLITMVTFILPSSTSLASKTSQKGSNLVPKHHLRGRSIIYDDAVVHNSGRLIICTAVVILGKKAGVHIMERGQFNDKSLDYISGHSDLYERTPTFFAYETLLTVATNITKKSSINYACNWMLTFFSI